MAAGDEDGAGDGALVVLVLLAHVEEGGGAEAGLRLVGLDLADAGPGLGEQLSIAGHP